MHNNLINSNGGSCQHKTHTMRVCSALSCLVLSNSNISLPEEPLIHLTIFFIPHKVHFCTASSVLTTM